MSWPLNSPTTRLYFTSFQHPAPKPDTLNNLPDGPDNKPPIRGQPQASTSATPDDDAKYYYFTLDDQMLYLSFSQDWGPLNLAMVYKACILIHELLQVRQQSCSLGWPPISCHRTRTWRHTDSCCTPRATHAEKRTRPC